MKSPGVLALVAVPTLTNIVGGYDAIEWVERCAKDDEAYSSRP